MEEARHIEMAILATEEEQSWAIHFSCEDFTVLRIAGPRILQQCPAMLNVYFQPSSFTFSTVIVVNLFLCLLMFVDVIS